MADDHLRVHTSPESSGTSAEPGGPFRGGGAAADLHHGPCFTAEGGSADRWL